MDDQNCSTCAHWLQDPARDRPETYYGVRPVPGYGRCAFISDPPETASVDAERSRLELTAFIDLDDPYVAAPLMTRPGFGCHAHTPRPQPC